MKSRFIGVVFVLTFPLHAQQLQWHYDPRRVTDPASGTGNFSTLYFEYFRGTSSDSSFVTASSSLVKMQCDFSGLKGNIGKAYVQVSQCLRMWDVPVSLDVEYSGGLGIAEPGSYPFTIANTYSCGAATTFARNGVWLTAIIAYSHTSFELPSHDVRAVLYWWMGLWKGRGEWSGDIQFWTQNRDHGDASTAGPPGKIVAIYGEPQLWFNLNAEFAVGVRATVHDNVEAYDHTFRMHPTLGLRYRLE